VKFRKFRNDGLTSKEKSSSLRIRQDWQHCLSKSKASNGVVSPLVACAVDDKVAEEAVPEARDYLGRDLAGEHLSINCRRRWHWVAVHSRQQSSRHAGQQVISRFLPHSVKTRMITPE
jgi:hypothetical protein